MKCIAIIQRPFPRIALIGYQIIAFILLFFRNVVSESNQIYSLKIPSIEGNNCGLWKFCDSSPINNFKFYKNNHVAVRFWKVLLLVIQRYFNLGGKKGEDFIVFQFMSFFQTIILDMRMPCTPVARLTNHRAAINGMAWAPHSSCHICTSGKNESLSS